MKITKTIKKEETVTVDVTLPYFSKSGIHHFAILSESLTVRVSYSEYGGQIETLASIASDNQDNALNAAESTAKEFEDAYEKAADYLHTKFESMRDTLRERKYDINDNLTINE